MPRTSAAAPAHGPMGPVARSIEVLCLAGAGFLLAFHAFRCLTQVDATWWVPIAIVGAGLTADLLSGLVHWTADTWGHESMPVLGKRFLRPFRIHHVNPLDFLNRDFVDCNGDVAMLNLPLLVLATLIPLGSEWANAAVVFLVSLAAWQLPTNQVHQWAHMANPPRCVAWLQRHGIILSREAHEQHHVSPYAVNYCIATGWCNRWLTRREVFPRLERAIASVTGMVPRADSP